MNTTQFVPSAQKMVAEFHNKNVARTDSEKIESNDVFVVWYSKTLQNSKGLLATPLPDGMYYEVTYNGNDDDFYLDAYRKLSNELIHGKDV